MSVAGSVTFTFRTRNASGPFPATYNAEGYLDVTRGGRDYPDPDDFNKYKTVATITFQPGEGKATTWTSWAYFNSPRSKVDQFAQLR